MLNLKSFVPLFSKKKDLTGLTGLTVRVSDFNLVAQRPAVIKKLRTLTLNSTSGLNNEIDNLLNLVKRRPVDCKIIRAYLDSKLVGWAILSRENSDFNFPNTDNGFSSDQGVLFEVYVHPEYRRKGVGTKIIETAKKKSGKQPICLCPWNSTSRAFFNNFKKYNPKEL